MNKRLLVFVIILATLLFPLSAAAQSEELQLNLSRDWGYGGGVNIEGTFSLRCPDLDNLVQVDFIIDGEIVNTDTESPFRWQFKTEQFDPGMHKMTAEGTLADGTKLQARTIEKNFLSAEEAGKATRNLLIPILGVSLGITVLSAGGAVLFGRKKDHKPGQYGVAGGTVCTRCQLPFSRSVFSPNLVVGKLVRCPHCGKWFIARQAGRQELEAAEQRYAQETGAAKITEESEEDKLRRMIDDSRFN